MPDKIFSENFVIFLSKCNYYTQNIESKPVEYIIVLLNLWPSEIVNCVLFLFEK